MERKNALVTLIILALAPLASAQYGGGSGTADDPYLIYSPEQMNAIGADPNNWDKHFKLMADIDLAQYTGTDFNLIGKRSYRSRTENPGPFTGVFDGNGHIITNFTWRSSTEDRVALFRTIDSPNAEIRDVHLVAPIIGGTSSIGALVGRFGGGIVRDCSARDGHIVGKERDIGGLVGRNDGGAIVSCSVQNVHISGGHSVGGLTGYNKTGDVNDCHANGQIESGSYIGGLVGYLEDGTLENSDARSTVIGDDVVGGLVGSNEAGMLTNCHAIGNVTTSSSYAGGLVASNGGTITNCYATGSVVGAGDYLGGLAGSSNGTITACYATGAVTGRDLVGGLLGYVDRGTVANCYARGNVTGGYNLGGLIGLHGSEIPVTNCYATGKVTGGTDAGGLIGCAYGPVVGCFWDIETTGQTESDGGFGRTTSVLQTVSTFLGWGSGIWTVDEGVDYPRLWWEKYPGVPIEGVDYPTQAGTADDPILIHTAEEMAIVGWVPSNWDKHFKLMADIDLAAFTENSFTLIGEHYDLPFTGVFDGNGHTISNFTYRSVDRGNVGLFGMLCGPGAEVKNLGLIAPNVETGRRCYVAGLVGCLCEGRVASCYVEGGTIVGADYKVEGSNVGDVLTDSVAGLVGYNRDGCIANCYSTATAIAEGSLLYIVGGLVGNNRGTVTACYSTGMAISRSHGGCLMGGGNDSATSFWDVETNGQTDNKNGIALTAIEMQNIDTYLAAGWDFIDESDNGSAEIWYLPEEGGYPRLTVFAGYEPPLPDGEGTATAPYLISDVNELCSIGFRNAAYYCLDADIDLAGTSWITSVIPLFPGSLDGNGHVIRNLHIQGDGNLGLFGDILSGALVTNVRIENACVESPGDYVGGMAGRSCGRIVGCYCEAAVTGNYCTGGMVGYLHHGVISTSYSTGSVSGDRRVGGLVGYSFPAGYVSNSYSNGSVSGLLLVGGLIGYTYRGGVTKCYSTGPITCSEGFYVGGLVGCDVTNTTTRSFWDVETSGQDTSVAGTGLTTAEMQTAATFLAAGWDFVGETENGTEEIWWIDEGADYPRLWWEASEEAGLAGF